jgi:hypothetical protein
MRSHFVLHIMQMLNTAPDHAIQKKQVSPTQPVGSKPHLPAVQPDVCLPALGAPVPRGAPVARLSAAGPVDILQQQVHAMQCMHVITVASDNSNSRCRL